MDDRRQLISEWLRRRVNAAGARGLVVGMSGDIDSAVVAALCQIATPGQVLAVIMPCRSDPQDEADAQSAADHFGLTAIRIDLQRPFGALVEQMRAAVSAVPPERRSPAADHELDTHAGEALGHVEPRLRMAVLYYLSDSLHYLVAGTANRSRLTVGGFTKHGDGGVDLLPLGGLLEGEVRALAVAMGVPDAILARTPGESLRRSPPDDGGMDVGYSDVDRYLLRGPEGVPPALALRLERMIRSSEHKRLSPPIPE